MHCPSPAVPLLHSRWFKVPNTFCQLNVILKHKIVLRKHKWEGTTSFYSFISLNITRKHTLGQLLSLLWPQCIDLSFTRLLLILSLDVVCSGNGVCAYTDPSGNTLASCTIFDTTCSATCQCPNFGGKDCSLDTGARKSRDDVRWVLTSLDYLSMIRSFTFRTPHANYSLFINFFATDHRYAQR